MTLLRAASWLLPLLALAPLAACGIVLESGSETPSGDAGTSSGQTASSSSGSSSGTASSSSSGAPSSSSGAISSGGSSSGCVPLSCAGTGRVCGILDDGCGGVVECGACGNGGGCVDGQCACPEVPPNACPGHCGVIRNECGSTRDCNLDNCDEDRVCNLGNNDCECPPVLAVECAGKCGKITNGCGNFIECPGACPSGETCGNDNTCSCVPEPKETTCAKRIGNPTAVVCGMTKNNCDVVVDCGTACAGGLACEDCDGPDRPQNATCCR